VAAVFRAIADCGNYDQWNPTIRSSRKLSEGEPGPGARFEWELRGFGAVVQELEEFEANRRLRIVPVVDTLAGGHRFVLTPEGQRTRVDHELELIPRGRLRALAPIMGLVGRKNLRDTASALQRHLEAR
jgi:hypothetical protein